MSWRPRSPVRRMQAVKQTEQLIGHQLRGTTMEGQRIETDRALGVGRIEQHHVTTRSGGMRSRTSAMRSDFGSMTTTARPACMS